MTINLKTFINEIVEEMLLSEGSSLDILDLEKEIKYFWISRKLPGSPSISFDANSDQIIIHLLNWDNPDVKVFSKVVMDLEQLINEILDSTNYTIDDNTLYDLNGKTPSVTFTLRQVTEDDASF